MTRIHNISLLRKLKYKTIKYTMLSRQEQNFHKDGLISM